VGTAGHVDHGKSSLVRRLTGIDPDRLAEEKAREMTIDLGFAWLTLPDGETLGIVDVPGHRDFIENMLAGVGGIDSALLVIAADEGVMPQTREHLAILDLLGITSGIIVLSKIDMIDDADWLDLVETEILDFVSDTALANAPVVRVSARTGVGVDALITILTQQLQQLAPRTDYNQPRLPVDRVFSISGFGTVVTGTLSGGTLQIGDEIEIQPGGLKGRIRGLQSYKQAVQVALPGSRVAVNIVGIERTAITRGDVVAYPGQLQATPLIDVHFRHLDAVDRPLRHNAQVKFFSGASESLARVRLLSDDQLAPHAEGWLQLELETPIPLTRSDRFILRYPSPAQTIGGGIVVNPQPGKRWRRFRPEVIAALTTQMQGTPAERITQAAVGETPVKAAHLQHITGYSLAELEAALQEALAQRLIVRLPDNTYLTTVDYQKLLARMMKELQAFHAAEPLRAGMPREELRSRLNIKNALLTMLLEMQSDIVPEGSITRLKTHEIRFTPAQQQTIQVLFAKMNAEPFTPPSYTEATAITGEPVLKALVERGELVQVAPDVIFTIEAYATLVTGILAIIDVDSKVDAKSVRDKFNSSRKYVIALLEHLDAIGITQRQGDDRVRGKNALG
jgi:selenocysteine-specific elongation factor